MIKKTIIILISSVVFIAPVYPKDGYYFNRKPPIKFKIVDESKKNDTLVKLKDLDGEVYFLKDETIVEDSDVEGVEIDKGYITIYFKRSSWKKVRRVTKYYLKNNIAIIKNNVVITIAKLMDPLTSSVSIAVNDEVDIEWFLRGFERIKKPKHIDSEEEYQNFLVLWLKKYPNDFNAVSDLAYSLIKKREDANWEKAVTLFEELVTEFPEDAYYLNSLSMCYVALNRYQDAINSINRLINLSGGVDVWAGYLALGGIYEAIGSYKDALRSYERARSLLEDAKYFRIGVLSEFKELYKFFSIDAIPDKKNLSHNLKTKISSLKKYSGDTLHK